MRVTPALPFPALPVPLLLENLFLSALPKAQHELLVPGVFLGDTVFSRNQNRCSREPWKQSHSQNAFFSVFFTQKKRDYLNLWKMIAGVRRAAQS